MFPFLVNERLVENKDHAESAERGPGKYEKDEKVAPEPRGPH